MTDGGEREEEEVNLMGGDGRAGRNEWEQIEWGRFSVGSIAVRMMRRDEGTKPAAGRRTDQR